MRKFDYILSGIPKTYTLSHFHDNKFFHDNEFLVVGVREDNKILIRYIKKLKPIKLFWLNLFNIFKEITPIHFIDQIIITSVSCVLLSSKVEYTLFISFLFNNKYYVYQLNCLNDEILEYKKIKKLFNTTNIYLGYYDILSIKYIQNYNYTQTTEIKLDITGMLYIETDNIKDISYKYIRNKKIYFNDNEKEKLLKQNLISNYNIYPIVDDWSEKDEVISKLPHNIHYKFDYDFSSGLLILKFTKEI